MHRLQRRSLLQPVGFPLLGPFLGLSALLFFRRGLTRRFPILSLPLIFNFDHVGFVLLVDGKRLGSRWRRKGLQYLNRKSPDGDGG